MTITVAFTGIRFETEVEDPREASELFCGVRDSRNYGASDMEKGCGELTDGNTKVGRVSYNGTVWDINENILFNANIEEIKEEVLENITIKASKQINERDCQKIALALDVDYNDIKLLEDNQTVVIVSSSETSEKFREEGVFFEEVAYALNVSRADIEEIN